MVKMNRFVCTSPIKFFQFVSEQPSKTNTILGTDASPNGETHCRLLEEISESCMVLFFKSTTHD